VNDFAQSGLITTLQRLNDSHFPKIESELAAASTHSIALVLPCHSADLDRPPLQHIIAELRDASWLAEVFVSMNGPDSTARDRAASLFKVLPCPVRVIWNEGGGKGENVAQAFRTICAENLRTIIATQDCDVASFRRHDLARLCYPIAVLGYEFSKAYYSRATDRLYGRVSRLFLAPLLHAAIRVAGHHPLLDFLLSFRYPLAGEVALSTQTARMLPIAGGWGLELAMLCDVFRHVDPRKVCQVDGGSGYDHKHQPASTSLAEMTAHIAAELFRQLAAEGLQDSPPFRSALADAYRRESAHSLRRSGALARINGLTYDAAAEETIVAAFHKRLAEQVGD
jgi:glucosyl-3-phosphoglycerate synthase